MINIALSKGRLGDLAFKMLKKIGYSCSEMESDSRKLIFKSIENNVCYLLVKPSDVCIYVERGAADIGIVGKDTIMESSPDVFELLDLGIGKCRVAAAAPEYYVDNTENTLIVATKYPNITRNYYNSINRDIDIIRLNGSIEIAPLIGLSDIIIDLVETGSTLKENGLKIIIDNIASISARLIANKSAYHFKSTQINDIVTKLSGVIKND